MEVVDLDIERLVHIDQRIDANESDALRARWEFGHHMLDARDGAGCLPNGYRAALINRTGKSAAELTYRMQFAEAFPTEDALFNALNNHSSWRELDEGHQEGRGPDRRASVRPRGQVLHLRRRPAVALRQHLHPTGAPPAAIVRAACRALARNASGGRAV